MNSYSKKKLPKVYGDADCNGHTARRDCTKNVTPTSVFHITRPSQELRIAQSVISRLWQRFQDDGNVTAQVTPELQRRMRTGIFGSYCQKKQTEPSIRPVSSALFRYQYDSFKANRVQTLRAH
ncbi:uncharacterized protein TNCV_490831 [Trichonephila clavipes]|nr:uncharacterized protein TNCV_490831 [Trichonephila clavipes]